MANTILASYQEKPTRLVAHVWYSCMVRDSPTPFHLSEILPFPNPFDRTLSL